MLNFIDFLELKNDYKQYNNDDYYSFREFVEIFEEWEQDNRDLFYTLVQTLDIDFSRAINIIKNQEYIIYDDIEEYIYNCLSEEGCSVPSWVCIDVYYTWFTNLRYVDELYFLKELPKWAEDGEEYGSQDKKDLWREGKKWLIENSEVIWLCD
jgi:hypothetical protein